MEDFDGVTTEFITGDHPDLDCERLLGGGGYGKVYLVTTFLHDRFSRDTAESCQESKGNGVFK